MVTDKTGSDEEGKLWRMEREPGQEFCYEESSGASALGQRDHGLAKLPSKGPKGGEGNSGRALLDG